VLALAVVLLSALLAAVSALSGLLTGLLAAALLLLTRSLLPLVLVRFLRVLVHCHSPMGPTPRTKRGEAALVPAAIQTRSGYQ